jgi:hypothetical protein
MRASGNTVQLRKNPCFYLRFASSVAVWVEKSICFCVAERVRSSSSARLCGWGCALRVGSRIARETGLWRRRVGHFGDNSDGFGDVDGRERPVGFATNREAAHLAFYAALVSSMPARRNALLQDFVEHRAMQRKLGRAIQNGLDRTMQQGRLGRRGENRRTAARCGGRLGSRARTTVDPDPRRRAAPLRA